MDQTTLNQFFVARKNSLSTALPPAKRVKLDSTEKIERIKRTAAVKVAAKGKTDVKSRATSAVKPRRTAASGNAKSKSKTVEVKPEEKIFNLFKAKPLEGKDDEPVGQMKISRRGRISGHVENCGNQDVDEVFTAVKAEKGAQSLCPTTPKKGLRPDMKTPERTSRSATKTPQKSPLSESLPKCNQLPAGEEAVSPVDHTKTILYSRGSAILKAGYERLNNIKSPSKASEVLNLLSPQKKFSSRTLEIIGSPTRSPFKSPTKLSEVLSTLSPRKLNYESAAQKFKSPQKIPSASTTTSTAPAKGSAASILSSIVAPSEKPSSSSRAGSTGRDRLRNKFKHLIGDGTGKNQPICEHPIGESSNDAQIVSHVEPKKKENISLSEIKNIAKQDPVLEKSNHLPNTVKGHVDVTPTEPTPAPKERASQRFKHLAQKSTPVSKSTFVLPPKFKELLEMFRCVDSILFLLHQRSEICTFEKLKRAVQEMSSKNFLEEHLAAMKTVLPNAFVFRQEKGLISLKEHTKSGKHQLTIEANFKEHLMSNSSKVTSNVLITRRLQFETRLVDIVKVHHQKFLRKLNMDINDSEIHRWHPNFNLNNVPDIELSALPQAPLIKTFSTAADLMTNNRGRFAPKVENALLNVANKSSIAEKEDKTNTNTNVHKDKPDKTSSQGCEQKSNSSNKLKGVSNSLLERIRQKEQLKNQLAMTRDPAKEERLAKMQRLPEMCRILKSFFTTEKKVAITLEDCVQKMGESYGTSISAAKLEEHVVLLSELVPEWLTIAMVRKFPFVKLSKGYDINKAINSLNDIRTKEEET